MIIKLRNKKYNNKALRFIRQTLYPARCPICQDIVVPKSVRICPGCRMKVTYISEPSCKKCGKQLYVNETEYCFDCRKKKFSYDYGMAVFLYDKVIRESIANFKFKGKKEYADFYAEELVRVCKRRIEEIAPDIIIPVPVHAKKLKQRGFNQAQLISERISGMLNIEEDHNYLIRVKNTLPQKQLNDEQREKNLKDAFEVNRNYINFSKNYKRVLLVDDIYTTGSTIENCSKTLIANGATNVYFVCLCIGCGY